MLNNTNFIKILIFPGESLYLSLTSIPCNYLLDLLI